MNTECKVTPAIINGREVKVGDKVEGIRKWGGGRYSSGNDDDAGEVVEITQFEIVVKTPRGEVRAQRWNVCDEEPMKVFSGCTECGVYEEHARLTILIDLPGKRFCDVCLVKHRTTYPKVIVLCGSSRYVDVMAVCAWLLERDEKAIVLSLHLLPGWYPDCPGDHLAEHEGVADAMDELHLRKIDLADEIFVVNVKHYIGESTTKEVEYTKRKGLPIRWFTDDPIGKVVNGYIEGFINENENRPGPTDGIAEEDVTKGVLRDGNMVRYPNGWMTDFHTYLKLRAKWAAEDENMRISYECVFGKKETDDEVG